MSRGSSVLGFDLLVESGSWSVLGSDTVSITAEEDSYDSSTITTTTTTKITPPTASGSFFFFFAFFCWGSPSPSVSQSSSLYMYIYGDDLRLILLLYMLEECLIGSPFRIYGINELFCIYLMIQF